MASSNAVLEACKATKKRNQTLYNFEAFAKIDTTVNGFHHNHVPFRETIRLFLNEFAVIENYKVSGMPIWSISLITNPDGVVFPLYTIEEIVHSSPNPFCDHCKFAGWGHHFVCKRRYRIIIPANEYWKKPLRSNYSKLQNHLLHGLIHSNGYGHLVCINGDSDSLNSNDLMDFWDRVCTMLKTRKMSVRDVSKEGEMELRLLNGVAYGRCWFGKWGYILNSGRYGVTEQEHETAIQFLSSLGLDRVVNDFKNNKGLRNIKEIINKYRDVSVKPLITMSDLLQVMLGVKSSAPRTKGLIKSTICNKVSRKGAENGGEVKENGMSLHVFVNKLVNKGCRWSSRRLKDVLKVIVDLLKENKVNGDGNFGMSRHELREEARKCIGDTGLIDFVLKSIRCFSMGTLIVRRMNNLVTNLLEFTIHENITEEADQESFNFPISDYRWSEERSNQVVYCSIYPAAKRVKFAIQDGIDLGRIDEFERSPPSSFDVYEDLMFLYKNVLLDYSGSEMVNFATRVVLDSKQYVKEWLFDEQVNDQKLMTLTCQVLPSFDELETELTRPLSPGEIVIVPESITIKELKTIAQCALRNTYCIMENFVVNQIGGLRAVEDEKVLSCTVKPGSHVWIRGSGLDLDSKLRYEDGAFE